MSISQTNLSEARRALLEKQLQRALTEEAPAQVIGRRPANELAPLSFAQRRLWFLHQWEPDSPAYNVPSALRLVGELDVVALRQAFNEIVRRHEVLRMVYPAVDDEPAQVLHPDPWLPLEVLDLSALPAGEREREVQRRLADEISRPFDLARDLPIRTALLRLDETEHVLLMTLHHIATDGWSMGVFVKELMALYEAFYEKRPSQLPELPIQYADFGYWQRQWLQGAELERQLAYWKRQLAGAPTVLELPTDRPRPAVRTYHGSSHYFRLPPALTQALEAFARRAGATPFMTLLAAYQALLYRYSGQDDLVVGTPIANRNRPDIEGLIGFFVNTLALRSDLSDDPSFEELVARVRETALEAYAHQDLPFEKLVDELQPERSLSHTPFFQTVFMLQNTPAEEWRLPGLVLTPVEIDLKTAKFDLTLAMWEAEGGLEGALGYNTDLFDAATITRLGQHFETLLENALADPEQPLSELALLSQAERRRLLVEWNDTRRDYPADRPVHEWLEAQAQRQPTATAVSFGAQRLSYQELNSRANQLAHYLQELGVGPETLVGMCMERSLDVLVGVLGILKAGGAYVPLDPKYPRERLAFIIDDSRMPVLLTQAELLAELPARGARTVCLDSEWGDVARQSSQNPSSGVLPENPAYVIYTSGSTGQPKGVPCTHRGLADYVHWFAEFFFDGVGHNLPAITQLTFDASLKQLFAPLLVGREVWVLPEEVVYEPDALVRALNARPEVGFNCVPSLWRAILDTPEAVEQLTTSSISRLLLGGEALDRETVQRTLDQLPDLEIWNLYGPTEATANASVGQITRADRITIGRPIANTQLYILDRHMRPVPVGVAGELYIAGAGLARGYLNRPRLTAEAFRPNPFPPLEEGARLYKTGDRARYLPDGRIEFLGRVDHQVKVRGFRIELGEVEATLAQHPAVGQVVASAREDPDGYKRLVAYLVPQNGRVDEPALTITELRNFMTERLPQYMVPSAFVTLDALPLMRNGKVDRRALPEPQDTRLELETDFIAPRNAVETRIAAIWSEVLGIETIGIDDDFFDLGGESFKAFRATRRIDESLSVMEFFKHPTVRELAQHLSHERGASDGLLHELTRPVPAGQRVISLVCVPAAGAGAITFHPLAGALSEGYSLYALEPPGHDMSRPDEALLPLEELAQRVVAEIQSDIDGPIALYGQCMGGALTIEIARLLEAAGAELVGIFLGGHFPWPRRPPGRFFALTDKVLPMLNTRGAKRLHYEAVRALGGFTEELASEERAFTMRNYFHDSVEGMDYYTRAYEDRAWKKLKTPVLSIIGQSDRVTEFYEERYKEWEHFAASVDLATIPHAGHYFVKHQADELAQIMVDQVAAWQRRVREATPSPASAPHPKRAVAPSLNVFSLVALGQFVSLLGTGLSAFALDIWVLQETQVVTNFAFITVLLLAPNILLAPFAGAVADRWDRRRVMILSDVVAACGTLLVAALLWTGSLQLWHVYVSVVVGAIANTFQAPAYAAAITQLVPKQYLGRINGLVQLGEALGLLAAPMLGGVLLMLVNLEGVILIDLATFVFAVTTLLRVRFPNTLFRKREETFLQEVWNGWRYIRNRHGLLMLIVFFAAINFLSSIVTTLVTPLVLSSGSPAVVGTVAAALGVGVLVGSLTMSLWGGTKRRAEGILGFSMLFGVCAVLMGLRPSPIYPAIGLFGQGFSVALVRSHWFALAQTKVGLELQGRVIAINRMLSRSMMPLGAILAGQLADELFEPLMSGGGPLAGALGPLIGSGPGRGMGLIMILVGLVGLVWTTLSYRYRPLRFIEDDLPDAIPDAIIVEDKDELQSQADRQLLAESAGARMPAVGR